LQVETPVFWKGRLEDVEAAVVAVRRGTSRVIAHSPGGRPVYCVAYGSPINLQRQANYNSARRSRRQNRPNPPPCLPSVVVRN
jgi:hypothetical protein